MNLSEWAKDLFETIKWSYSSDDILTKETLARILNKKYWISDNWINSYLIIWQFKHIESLLVELEMAKFVSIVGNVISLKK